MPMQLLYEQSFLLEIDIYILRRLYRGPIVPLCRCYIQWHFAFTCLFQSSFKALVHVLYNLTLMVLVANLSNTKTWRMGTQLRVLSESFLMNTNMTGVRWVFFNTCVVVLWTTVASSLLEGLVYVVHLRHVCCYRCIHVIYWFAKIFALYEKYRALDESSRSIGRVKIYTIHQ